MLRIFLEVLMKGSLYLQPKTVVIIPALFFPAILSPWSSSPYFKRNEEYYW
jgi:hypothetical protein